MTQAHDEGILHYHDMDYGIQQIFNCCLVNMEDVLGNGTVINKKGVDRPKSFQTACTIATQVMAQIASGQYGGQTISLAHLAPYVRVSYEKYLREFFNDPRLVIQSNAVMANCRGFWLLGNY